MAVHFLPVFLYRSHVVLMSRLLVYFVGGGVEREFWSTHANWSEIDGIFKNYQKNMAMLCHSHGWLDRWYEHSFSPCGMLRWTYLLYF